MHAFKKPPIQKCLIFLEILVLFYSCRTTPVLYYPNALNMPLASEKHELKVTASYGSDGIGFRGSYAVDSHLLIYANGCFIGNGWRWKLNNPENTIVGAGVGYYTKFEGHGRLDIMAGAGYLTTNSQTNNHFIEFFSNAPDSNENLHIIAKFFSGSLQANLGYVSENVCFGFGLRFTNLYLNGNYFATYTDQKTNNFLSQKIIPLKGNSLFVEPGFAISYGNKDFKVTADFGLSYQNNGFKIDGFYGPLYSSPFVTLGISLNLFNGY